MRDVKKIAKVQQKLQYFDKDSMCTGELNIGQQRWSRASEQAYVQQGTTHKCWGAASSMWRTGWGSEDNDAQQRQNKSMSSNNKCVQAIEARHMKVISRGSMQRPLLFWQNGVEV